MKNKTLCIVEQVLLVALGMIIGIGISFVTVEIKSQDPMSECRNIVLINRIDEEMFKIHDEFEADVIKLLHDSYSLPKSDVFDGTGIYILNKRLINFTESIKLLREERDLYGR